MRQMAELQGMYGVALQLASHGVPQDAAIGILGGLKRFCVLARRLPARMICYTLRSHNLVLQELLEPPSCLQG